MDINACFQLGHVIKVHGLNGQVNIFLDVDYPQDYQNLESVFVEIDKRLVPFFISKIKLLKDKATVKFEDIDSADDAQRLLKCQLYLPLTALPKLNSNQFYYHEITGFKIHDEELGELGTVSSVYDTLRQDLIAMDYKGKEILIPIGDEIIKSVDREKSILYTLLPEGLIDIYFED